VNGGTLQQDRVSPENFTILSIFSSRIPIFRFIQKPRPSADTSCFMLAYANTKIDTDMTAIPRKYITDAMNQKQVVIVDIETFNRMESIIEDNGLAMFMAEAEDDEILSVHDAKKH